jgi:myosin heavy subunit
MSADKPIDLPPIDAIASLADMTREESLEFTEIIGLEIPDNEIEEDFWDFLACCHEKDIAMSCSSEISSEPDLYAVVEQIESALIESEQKLELQSERSRSANRLIARQTAELNEVQSQLAQLLVELEAVSHAKQQQQEIVDRLTDKLQQARRRTAAIERECCELQTKYQHQTERLLQTEARAKELSFRLDRQQRYTLQFKTALDECLEVPAPQLFQAKPIPAWSKQIYRSRQAKTVSVGQSSRSQPSFSLTNPNRELRSMSEVSLPKFSNN